MGFWTPEYVEKKLAQLAGLEDVAMLVAVDESLGVGEEIAARDHRAIPYSGTVRVKDVADVLREYERQLVAKSAARLPDALRPADDAVTVDALADRHGASPDALADKAFPEHERVGRTLVRPAVLESVADEIEPGMALADAEAILEAVDLTDSSAILSRLGYRVEWEGLAGDARRTVTAEPGVERPRPDVKRPGRERLRTISGTAKAVWSGNGGRFSETATQIQRALRSLLSPRHPSR